MSTQPAPARAQTKGNSVTVPLRPMLSRRSYADRLAHAWCADMLMLVAGLRSIRRERRRQ